MKYTFYCILWDTLLTIYQSFRIVTFSTELWVRHSENFAPPKSWFDGAQKSELLGVMGIHLVRVLWSCDTPPHNSAFSGDRINDRFLKPMSRKINLSNTFLDTKIQNFVHRRIFCHQNACETHKTYLLEVLVSVRFWNVKPSISATTPASPSLNGASVRKLLCAF